MKRSFIVILIIFIQSVVALAQNADIDAIETSLYGYDYKNESDTKRVERLEKHLYGHKKSGNILKRIENIKNDIGFVEIKETTKDNVVKEYRRCSSNSNNSSMNTQSYIEYKN